jgi:hypothetical protein
MEPKTSAPRHVAYWQCNSASVDGTPFSDARVALRFDLEVTQADLYGRSSHLTRDDLGREFPCEAVIGDTTWRFAGTPVQLEAPPTGEVHIESTTLPVAVDRASDR